MEEGRLSVVATPIGNLEDITLRALRTLKECDYILCEDTRVTGKLLKHYDIATPTKRYDAHASQKVHDTVLADLQDGMHIALVSDAGTPGISDPGVLLIQQIRTVGHPMSNSSGDVKIEVVPGPSAVTAAFSIAGIAGNQFVFLGYAPQKKGRQTFFNSIALYKQPVLFFESTHRILKTLDALEQLEINSNVNITIYLARELTKLHEEVLTGTPAQVLQVLCDDPQKQKGEFVVLVEHGKSKVESQK